LPWQVGFPLHIKANLRMKAQNKLSCKTGPPKVSDHLQPFFYLVHSINDAAKKHYQRCNAALNNAFVNVLLASVMDLKGWGKCELLLNHKQVTAVAALDTRWFLRSSFTGCLSHLRIRHILFSIIKHLCMQCRDHQRGQQRVTKP
jgi:hypothetical protein